MSSGLGDEVSGLVCGCPRLGSVPSRRQNLPQPAGAQVGLAGAAGRAEGLTPCRSAQPHGPLPSGAVPELQPAPWDGCHTGDRPGL